MKFKVTYEYRGRVTVEVEAKDEADVEKLGLKEADELIPGNLLLEDVTVRKVPAK